VTEFAAIITTAEQIGSDTWMPQRHVFKVGPVETVEHLFKRCWPKLREPFSGVSIEVVALDEEATDEPR
jgi:hypothetical protein